MKRYRYRLSTDARIERDFLFEGKPPDQFREPYVPPSPITDPPSEWAPPIEYKVWWLMSQRPV